MSLKRRSTASPAWGEGFQQRLPALPVETDEEAARRTRVRLATKYPFYRLREGFLPPLQPQRAASSIQLRTHPTHSCVHCMQDYNDQFVAHWKTLVVAELLQRSRVLDDEGECATHLQRVSDALSIASRAPRQFTALHSEESSHREAIINEASHVLRAIRRCCARTSRLVVSVPLHMDISVDPLGGEEDDLDEKPTEIILLRARNGLMSDEAFDRNEIESEERKMWIRQALLFSDVQDQIARSQRQFFFYKRVEETDNLLQSCVASSDADVGHDERAERNHLRNMMFHERRMIRRAAFRASLLTVEGQEAQLRHRIARVLEAELRALQRCIQEDIEFCERSAIVAECIMAPALLPSPSGNNDADHSACHYSRRNLQLQFVEFVEREERAAAAQQMNEYTQLLSDLNDAPLVLALCGDEIMRNCAPAVSESVPLWIEQAWHERRCVSSVDSNAWRVPSPLYPGMGDAVVLTDLSALRDALGSRQSDGGSRLARRSRQQPFTTRRSQQLDELRLAAASPVVEHLTYSFASEGDPSSHTQQLDAKVRRARRKTIF